MKLLPLLIAACLFTLAPPFAQLAHACECQDNAPVCALYGRADNVFIGVVTRIIPRGTKKRWQRDLVEFKVEKLFRGTLPAVVFDTQGQETDCKLIYKTGQRYLIYSKNNRVKNSILTSDCMGTTKLKDAEEALAYVRQARSGQTETYISGKVRDERSYKPISGLLVELYLDNAKQLSAATDTDGNYKFLIDTPGKYLIRIFGQKKAMFMTHQPSRIYELNGGDVVDYEETVVMGNCFYAEFSHSVLKDYGSDKPQPE